MTIRRAAILVFVLIVGGVAEAAPPDYPAVSPLPPLDLPRDHGAHPEFRTEWWYLTGWLSGPDTPAMGFQVTFFRSRPALDQANPSAFAARQIVMAHSALSDPRTGRLIHDQRVARAGFGRTRLGESGVDLALDDWQWTAEGGFVIHVPASGFTLDLRAAETQAPLSEGPGAVSSKGGGAASRYYSLPHLAITAKLDRAGHTEQLTGEGWFDHEWSSTLLPDGAVGWDWTALDLTDGGALMAFRVRDAAGLALWSGGTWRGADGTVAYLQEGAVRVTPRRFWRSAVSGANYPVASDVTVVIDGKERVFSLHPLMDDQELDSRLAGGPIYWEGAVSCEQGRGYLELTGYDKAFPQ
jgi:predicted secreted hydrolase